MPARWAIQTRGERFIQADRKNRVERARLDLQLKIYEREKMRNWGLAERERKFLVTNMESIKRTSGTSSMGVEPAGPKDNSYEKSMHSLHVTRLSEKRLMEWKICERQLQRFLKQKAVPADDVQVSDPRPLSSRSAWTEDSKKTVTAKERHGGKVEKERADVQRRVSQFLHSGMHIDTDRQTNESSENKTNGESKKQTKESQGRQRHHSEGARPHTAGEAAEQNMAKTKKRPASAFVPKKTQKSQFLITKGDVFMQCGLRYTKIIGSDEFTPQAKVNNFVNDMNSTRSPSPFSTDPESEPDVFIDEKLYADTRTSKPPVDYDDARSETKSIMSDKSSKKLVKHVSIASFLDELSEEELEENMRSVPQSTSRASSATSYSAFSLRSGVNSRSGNYSKRETTRSNYSKQGATTQPPTLEELDDEEEFSERSQSSRSQRSKDYEHPNMYTGRTVNQAVKSAMVFSKSARKKALENLVKINSPDKRELLRMERLRNAKSRSALLTTMTRGFNII